MEKGEHSQVFTSYKFGQISLPKQVDFSNVEYSVKVEGSSPKPIIRDVSAAVKPGSMLCILGPSGSGKTSLMQIISGRIKTTSNGSHQVSGKVLVNGEQISDTNFRRISGFVTQEDVFSGN